MKLKKRESDQEHFMGSSGDMLGIEIKRTEDFYFFDTGGRRYLDFTSSSCVCNLGWSQRELLTAAATRKRPAYVPPHFEYRPWGELARLLAEITPGELNKCYRTTGGSESVDAAMQIATIYTGRSRFVSVEGAYHGNTIGALSIGDSENRKTYKALLKGCYKIGLPLDATALEKLEKRLKTRDVAAFIMEPVITNLGVHIPAAEFMSGAQELCRKYGTLLVMDEVASGFGRTGKLFASEYYGIEPDIMCLAKAITGGYAGLGAVITTGEIASKIGEKFSLYSTFGWHPIAVDTALANIRYWKRHREKLLRHVTELSAYFRMRLKEMPFAEDPEIRILGLAIALGFRNESAPRKIKERALKAGLLVNAEDNNLTLFPAVNMDRDIAAKGLDILEESLHTPVRRISRMFRSKREKV